MLCSGVPARSSLQTTNVTETAFCSYRTSRTRTDHTLAFLLSPVVCLMPTGSLDGWRCPSPLPPVASASVHSAQARTHASQYASLAMHTPAAASTHFPVDLELRDSLVAHLSAYAVRAPAVECVVDAVSCGFVYC